VVADNEIARQVARFILQEKEVQLNPKDPFTWSSGLRSPIYCDNRITLSFPPIRTYIRQQLANQILSNFGKPDVIAGVATGAIAMGVLVAESLGLPFVYVRPEPKSHGMGKQVEGLIEPGKTVVIVEDLVSTGKSSLAAMAALKDTGMLVKGMACIFTYGFNRAELQFANAQCKLVSHCDYNALVQVAFEGGKISRDDIQTLENWRHDPDHWYTQKS
jgi:orotate phosphoribosyltransferase